MAPVAARSNQAAGRRDFPFYDGRPLPFTPAGASLTLLGCVLGFAALIGAPRLLAGDAGEWFGSVLFVLLPLGGLALAVGGNWRRIFHRPSVREVVIGLAFAPLAFLAPAGVALVLARNGMTSPNPINEVISGLEGVDLVYFFARTGLQLLGEELVTILPFLVLLGWLHGAGAPRRVAVLTAWIATALLFGALHLPTYQWHLAQGLLVIGAARLALTAAYLITKNLWVSYIAHVANDWSLFTLMLIFGARV